MLRGVSNEWVRILIVAPDLADAVLTVTLTLTLTLALTATLALHSRHLLKGAYAQAHADPSTVRSASVDTGGIVQDYDT